ncbi:unnamed protein product [Closterium sp. NIES-65]|nr:unnamed protein product [Closterium sp. NIES-65]
MPDSLPFPSPHPPSPPASPPPLPSPLPPPFPPSCFPPSPFPSFPQPLLFLPGRCPSQPFSAFPPSFPASPSLSPLPPLAPVRLLFFSSTSLPASALRPSRPPPAAFPPSAPLHRLSPLSSALPFPHPCAPILLLLPSRPPLPYAVFPLRFSPPLFFLRFSPFAFPPPFFPSAFPPPLFPLRSSPSALPPPLFPLRFSPPCLSFLPLAVFPRPPYPVQPDTSTWHFAAPMAAVHVSMSGRSVLATSASLRQPLSTHKDKDASFARLSAAHSRSVSLSPLLRTSSPTLSAAAAAASSAAPVVLVLAAKGGPKKNFKKTKKPAADPASAAEEAAADAAGTEEKPAKAPKAAKAAKAGSSSSSMKGRPAVDFTTEAMTDSSITVRVDVAGSETAMLFDGTLRSLAKECPPLPGARLGKGGKQAGVDKAVVLRFLGRSRVIGFIITELINKSLLAYLDQKGVASAGDAKTTQSSDELQAAYEPGKPFTFTAEVPYVKKEDEGAVGEGEEAAAAAGEGEGTEGSTKVEGA